MKITIKGTDIILDKERAIYLPEHSLLVISDLHAGKSAHFRIGGLQVPATLGQTDLKRLSMLFSKYEPERFMVTGDMFHHGFNNDIRQFREWRNTFQEINFILVKGNHDRLSDEDYELLNITVYDPSYALGPFSFIHEAPTTAANQLYPITGHIHPGVSLLGAARQRLRFPCFFFGATHAVLPAFSLFTGLAIMYPTANDRVFAITPERVLEVK